LIGRGLALGVGIRLVYRKNCTKKLEKRAVRDKSIHAPDKVNGKGECETQSQVLVVMPPLM